MRWRSMRSAPVDTPIIVHDGQRVGEAFFYSSADEWRWANDSCSCCWFAMSKKPLGWKPMPTIPLDEVATQ